MELTGRWKKKKCSRQMMTKITEIHTKNNNTFFAKPVCDCEFLLLNVHGGEKSY